MDILCCALALLGGVIGAGFASGREIVRFFAAHGAMGFIAVAFALAALLALFALLPIRLAAEGQTGLSGLCRARFGARVGTAAALQPTHSPLDCFSARPGRARHFP